jgi:hypothetical protein
MDKNIDIKAETELKKIRQEAQGRYDIARWQQDGGALRTPWGKL